jgi:hypothetical protein
MESDMFVGVSARESVLRAHADLLHYRIQLAHDVAVDLLHCGGDPRGSVRGSKPSKVPASEFEDEVCAPFIEFDVDEEEQYWRKYSRSPFKERKGDYEDGVRSIFVCSDRIRIITEVIKQAFNVEAMITLGLLKHSYPCHNQARLHKISSSWSLPAYNSKKKTSWWRKFHWGAKRDKIAYYFGTLMGFRIDFVRFLVMQMFPLSVCAPILLFLPDQHLVRTLIGLGLIIWAATVEEFWKRREVGNMVRWGQEEHEIIETTRPQFFGEMQKWEVDRRTLVRVYPKWKAFLRRGATWTVTFLYQALMVAVSLHLYHYHDKFLADGRNKMAFGTLCAVALQIRVCDMFWDYFGQWLGNFDNYETDSQYNDALLQRTFGVRFIVSFASLFYIAFVKHFSVGCGGEKGGEGDCLNLVASQLRTLFVTNMLFHLLSVIIPFATFRYHMYRDKTPAHKENEAAGYTSYTQLTEEEQVKQPLQPDDAPEKPKAPRPQDRVRKALATLSVGVRYPSFAETQGKMPEYTLAEEVYDVMDVIVELGYVLFFGFVAPEVLTLFLMSNCLRLHALGVKLVYTMRRPFPVCAPGLGVVFYKIFRLMSRAAVACNILVLLLTNSDFRGKSDYFLWLKELLSTPLEGSERSRDWKSMIVVFFVTDTAVNLLRWAIDLVIPDVPADVVLDKKRKRQIHMQLIRRATSELKRWEGKELEQAYREVEEDAKKPQILLTDFENGCDKQWAPIENMDDIKKVCPWLPQDPGFEKPWLLDNMGSCKSSDLRFIVDV